MERATEDFNWNGCIALASVNDVVFYEGIIGTNGNFLPIESGAFKFVIKVGGEYGLDSYTREKVSYEEIRRDIIKVYNEYVIFDEHSYDYVQMIKHLPTYKGLINKRKLSSRLQTVLKNSSGNFEEAFNPKNKIIINTF